MPLLKEDIRIFQADSMNDTPSGGGDITSIEVVSGVSNNIFDDVSPLSRIYGDVSLRKVFGSVFTQNVLKYYGSHTILSRMPKDKMLDVCLFNTNNWHDRRVDASSRIEAYRAQGADYFGFLFGTQYAGSQVVTIFQSEDAPIPTIGEVLFIKQASTNEEQFIKVLTISHDVRNFSTSGGQFARRIVELTISQPLKYDFYGVQISGDDDINPQAKLSKTVIADAGKYYSTRPSVEAASVGDSNVKVDSIFSQLVPSSLQEAPVVNVDAFQTRDVKQPTTAVPVELDTVIQFNAGSKLYFGSAVMPKSVTITTGGANITDLGGKVLSGGQEIGVINYTTGVISFNATAPTFNGVKTVAFIPSVRAAPNLDSGAFKVTDANRGLTYVTTLSIPPAAGSVTFAYRSFGKTYVINDNGSGGMIADDPSIGSGSIDYQTGTLSMTLGALPDVDTEIIIQWGQTTEYVLQQPQAGRKPYFKVILNHLGADPSTVALSWLRYGVAKTATIDSNGFISGDASGFYNVTTGEVKFLPNDMFAVDTIVTVAMTKSDTITYTQAGVVVNGSDELVIDVGDTNLLPNSVMIQYEVDGYASMTPYSRKAYPDVSKHMTFKIYDDGAGGLLRKSSDGTTTAIVGSAIDYATGIMSFNSVTEIGEVPSLGYNWNYAVFKDPSGIINGYGYYRTNQVAATAKPKVGGIPVTVKYRKATNSSAVTDTFTANALTMDLVPNASYYAVPSSLRFKWIGKEYVERNGIVYRDMNDATGVGIEAGSFNFATGEVSISSWHDGSADAPYIQSLLYKTNNVGKSVIAFNIPNAPIRVQSLQINATTLDGTNLSGTADANGVIDVQYMKATVNIESGAVHCIFGEMVTAAGNESEEWYDAGEVDGSGNIWKPIEVDESTVKYNAVAQTFIPLDKSILGLDPVRLPSDGRVPVFEVGDIVVIRNSVEVSGNYASATTLDLGRTNLAAVFITDNGGAILPTTKYTVDLDTGIINWLDLTGVSQPIKISHEVEDLGLLNDVQITGQLSFNSQLTHDYPVLGTVVSSALIHGDVFASVSEPFDQKTWTNVWSDTPIGDTVSGELNTSIYPTVVTNASCIEEDWALIFTNTTTVHVIGKTVGQIGTSVSINSDISINNPATGFPYFVLDHRAFGGGWSAGNVIRFKTIAANKPMWIIQSVKQGVATNTDDDALTFCLSLRGSRNA